MSGRKLGPRERRKLRERANEAFKNATQGFAPEGCVKIEAQVPVTTVHWNHTDKESRVTRSFQTVTVIHERETALTPGKVLQGTRDGNAIMVPFGRAIAAPDKRLTGRETIVPSHYRPPRSLTRDTAQSYGDIGERRNVRIIRGKVKRKLPPAAKKTDDDGIVPSQLDARSEEYLVRHREREAKRERALALSHERRELVCWLTERPKG